MDLSTVSKAIAGGLVAMVLSYLVKHGIDLTPVVTDAFNTLVLAVITYLVGHVAVYLAPANKVKTI